MKKIYPIMLSLCLFSCHKETGANCDNVKKLVDVYAYHLQAGAKYLRTDTIWQNVFCDHQLDSLLLLPFDTQNTVDSIFYTRYEFEFNNH